MDIQQTIKTHAEDLRDAVKELYEWEENAKKQDAALRKKTVIEPSFPPVRGSTGEKEFYATHGGGDTSSKPKPKGPDPIQVAKDQGNEYFKRGEIGEAIRMYTKGIDLDPDSSTTHVLYGNRAQCYLKQSKWDLAEKDATKAVQMNRTYAKAFFRRALARKELGKLVEAKHDLETCIVLEVDNEEAAKQMEAVTHMIRQQKKEDDSKKGGKEAPPAKKKLQIVEVEDDDEDDSAQELKRKEEEDKRKKEAEKKRADDENKRRIEAEQESQRKKLEAEAADRKKKAQEAEARQQRNLKTSNKVEVLDDDEPEPAPKPKPKAKHFDVKPRDVALPSLAKEKITPPKTFSDFEKTHATIQQEKNRELMNYYIAMIQAQTYRALFGSALSSDQLSDILEYANDPSNTPEKALEILDGLSAVQRIGEIVMFFDAKEKERLNSAFAKAGTVAGKEAMASLKKKFD